MPTEIRAHRQANKYTDKRCETCKRQTDGISNWCWRCLKRRKRYGHVKVARHLRHRDYAYLIGVTTKYLKRNPPPSDIAEAVLRFLLPPSPLPYGIRNGRRARALLITEMARWQSDPRYRKRWTDHGGYNRKADYSPRGILAVLIAVTAYIEERGGVGFPGEAEHVAVMFALTRLWKRPRRMGGSKGERYSHLVSGTVLRELVRRWREFKTLGLYVYMTAKRIVQEQAELRLTHAKSLPRSPLSQTEMRMLHEKWIAEKAARKLAERRAAFDKEVPPPDPGPRPFGAWDGSATMRDKIMEWSEAHSRFTSYHQRRKEFYPA